MDVKSRIAAARLIENINGNPQYAEKLGLLDASTFHGKPVHKPACKGPQDTKGGTELWKTSETCRQ